MLKIFRTEWLKIRNYPAFWLVMLMTMLSYPGVNYLLWNDYQDMIAKEKATGKMVKMLLGNPFTFPEVFHTSAFLSSIFVFIPALVVIMLITNEYTYKTNRQNIIDGWSRDKFLLAKLLDVITISLLVSLLCSVVAYVVGQVATEKEVEHMWKEVKYLPLFALQTFSQLSIAFLFGFIIRRSFIALAVFMFYYIILENAAVGFLRIKANDIGRYLPLEISDRLIPLPAFIGRYNEKAYQASLGQINIHVVYTIILIVVTWGICYIVNRRRDL